MLSFPETSPILSYTHVLRSRYGETDQMGYVYYGRYPEFFEVARTEMLRSMNLSYRKMEEDGVMLPVVSMQIKVMLFDKPLIRLQTYYAIYTERHQKPHVKGRVALCFIDSETRKPVKAPAPFLKKFES